MQRRNSFSNSFRSPKRGIYQAIAGPKRGGGFADAIKKAAENLIPAA